MTSALTSSSRAVTAELRMILLELARQEEDDAANEAADQPYWMACPPSVQGHRAAAAALRDQADRLLSLLRTSVSPLAGEAA